MDRNLNERTKYLENLENFISQSYERLKFVTDTLGWDLEQFDEEKEMVTCPLNAEHRMPVNKLESHLKRCKWKQEGYGEDDIPLPERSCAISSPTSVVIDEELQERILLGSSVHPPYVADSTRRSRPVPQTAERMRTDFTPGERLTLYNYAVANTESPTVVKAEDLNVTYKKNEEARPKSKLELLMEMRDAKRRRVSYRSKKVHTNRKSHLEILREVIDNQMEFLEESNKPEVDDEEDPFKLGNSSGEKLRSVNDKGKDFERSNSGKYLEDCEKARRRSPRRRHSTVSSEREVCSSRSDVEERHVRRYDDGRKKSRRCHRDGDSGRFRSRDFERSKSPQRERADPRYREKSDRHRSHGDRSKYHEKSDGATRRLGAEDDERVSPRSDPEPEGDDDSPERRRPKKSSKSHKHKKKKRKKHHRSSPGGGLDLTTV